MDRSDEPKESGRLSVDGEPRVVYENLTTETGFRNARTTPELLVDVLTTPRCGVRGSTTDKFATYRPLDCQ